MFENNNFLNAQQATERESKTIASRNLQKMAKYHLPFLDDCLLGILPNELVVIGADTGLGKTELVNYIALNNALNKKRVCLFSLEGDRDETIGRYKWRIICEEYYKHPIGLEMSFQKYLMNGLPELDGLKRKAELVIEKLGDYLKIFSRETELDYETLAKTLLRINDADLIIIDHLHYVPLTSADAEHFQISNIVRAIQQITKIKNMPVILVSHLRKKARDRGLPDNEDLHGSSNIAKEADTVILISEAENELRATTRASHYRISKSRTGAPRQYIGKIYYDTVTKNFLRDYRLSAFDGGKLKELSTLDTPEWAKNCVADSAPKTTWGD